MAVIPNPYTVFATDVALIKCSVLEIFIKLHTTKQDLLLHWLILLDFRLSSPQWKFSIRLAKPNFKNTVQQTLADH